MPVSLHGDHAHTAYLDGWRGISILLVLIGHFTFLPGIRWSQLGVELFFALSGRLMAQILFVERYPLGPFFARRFSRVWPALFVLVVLLAAIVRFGAWPPGEKPIGWGTAAAVLTFTIGYLRDALVSNSGSLEHIWSLAIEEHAYIILALIALAVRRHGVRPGPIILALALLSIASGAIRTLVFHQDYYAAYWLTDSKLASILLPALAFLHRDRLITLLGRLAPAAPLLCGVAGVLLHYHRVPDPIRFSIGPLLFGLAIVTLPCAGRWLTGLLEMRWLRWFGLMSFSLYLWQQPFLVASRTAPQPTRLFFLGLAILAGIASYHIVERPCRRWLNARFAATAARCDQAHREDKR